MDIQRKFLGSPINSQRCISSVLLGLHQESPKEVAELWELRAFSLWIWLKHFHKNGSLFHLTYGLPLRKLNSWPPENIPSHKERTVFQPSLFQGYKLAVKLPGGVCKSKLSNPHLFVSRWIRYGFTQRMACIRRKWPKVEWRIKGSAMMTWVIRSPWAQLVLYFPSLKAVHRKSSKVFCLPTQQKASNFGVGGYCSSKHRIWVWPTI